VNPVIVLAGAIATGFVGAGSVWFARSLGTAEFVLGVRARLIALLLPVFGPPGIAALHALLFHHSLRLASSGISVASVFGFTVAGIASAFLGIKSVDARVFRYIAFCIPISVISVVAAADSVITHFEAAYLFVGYSAFVVLVWWTESPHGFQRSHSSSGLPQTASTDRVFLLIGLSAMLAGSWGLIEAARFAGSIKHGSGLWIIGAGTVTQILAFAWVSLKRGNFDLIVASVAGFLAFDSAAVLGVIGLTAFHKQLDPTTQVLAAIATFVIPAILLPAAFKQTMRLGRDDYGRFSDKQMDNIFAWRNLKRDLSNYQLLRYRNVDGTLATGMNSGTHWVTIMLATAIAQQHGLALPKYFSFNAAGDIVGSPNSLKRRPGIPAIARSHNHPAASLAWPIVRRLVPYPKQVVLVRDIRDVLISAYVKWIPDREVSFSEFVKGDPANRRGYLCDVWWYISYLNRWGDIKASAPRDTLIVRYEDLVEDPSYWLRRMSDHFGLNLSDHALEAALIFREKKSALEKREPNDTERVVAAPEAKSAICFSDEDMRVLQNILSRHLRYDYGYDYGLAGPPLTPVERMAIGGDSQPLSKSLRLADIR
jgi:Sulfotransferase family